MTTPTTSSTSFPTMSVSVWEKVVFFYKPNYGFCIKNNYFHEEKGKNITEYGELLYVPLI